MSAEPSSSNMPMPDGADRYGPLSIISTASSLSLCPSGRPQTKDECPYKYGHEDPEMLQYWSDAAKVCPCDKPMAVFETSYETWLRWHSRMPDSSKKAVIIISDPPENWHRRPEFSGYLLKECVLSLSTSPGLKLIPLPRTGGMSPEQFWESEATPDHIRINLAVVTRHGRRDLDLQSVTKWVMEVDDDHPVCLNLLQLYEKAVIDYREQNPDA
ncbi:hypothetical protein F4677DRAFT_126730 [Hypoxylon crocopeplum]|nr:hypothetical protein F4677DRAFT_126730 [Hypoxylon crocopeplum]